MKNNSALITAFTVAAGLVSTVAVAGVDASAQANLQFEIQDVTIEGNADKIFWSVAGDANSAVEKSAELQNLGVHSPAGPEDLLGFLGDTDGVEEDVVYRPFEIAAAFAPADFRDRRKIMLDQLYPDDPAKLLESRERSAFVIMPPAAVDRIAEYQSPGGDYLDKDGRVETPTGRLQLAALEDKAVTVPSGTALTSNDILTLLKESDGKLNEEQYVLLKRLYSQLLVAERGTKEVYDTVEVAGLHETVPATFTPDSNTLELIKGIKDAAAAAEQLSAHTAFHVGDKVDVLTPHDVWTGGDTRYDMIDTVHEFVPPPTITDFAPSKISGCGTSIAC